MKVSDIIDDVESILVDYYNNTDISTSTLIIGGNTIQIDISGNEDSTITTTQVAKLVATLTVVGKYCMVLEYPIAYRIYLAVLMGFTTEDSTTPEHFSSSYADKIFGSYDISNVDGDVNSSTVAIKSNDFEKKDITEIQTYIEDLIDDDGDYGIDEIAFVDDSDDEIGMPIRVYYALISRYLIQYVENNGESKIVYVIINSVRYCLKLVSSNKIVNVVILDNDNAEISLEQLAELDAEVVFGVKSLDVEIKPKIVLQLIIATIVTFCVLVVFGTIGIAVDVKLIKRIKDHYFKNK